MLFVKQEIYSTTLFFLKTEAMQNTVLCCPRALRPRKPELIVLLVSWNANTLGFILVSGVICTLQTTSDKLFLVAHVRKCSLEAVLFHRYIKNVDRFTHNVQEQGFFFYKPFTSKRLLMAILKMCALIFAALVTKSIEAGSSCGLSVATKWTYIFNK